MGITYGAGALRPPALMGGGFLGTFPSLRGAASSYGCEDLLHERSVAQPCPTLCDPMDYNPPSSSVYGIPQARILERVAISFPIQGLNPCLFHLLHWQVNSLPLHHLGSLITSCQDYCFNYLIGAPVSPGWSFWKVIAQNRKIILSSCHMSH